MARLTNVFLPGAVFGSAILGIVLSIAVPWLLAPAEYARFSVTLAYTQLLSSVVFEWLRIVVIREVNKESMYDDDRWSTLVGIYLLIAAGAVSLGLALLLGARWIANLSTVGVVLIGAATQGLHDGRSAFARASFDNGRLSLSLLIRPTLAFVFVSIAAYLTKSHIFSLLALSLSYVVGIFVYDNKSLLGGTLIITRSPITSFAKFGLPAAIGTIIAQAVPALLRALVTSVWGMVGSAGILFAIDICHKGFSTIGMAFNMMYLQKLIRTKNTEASEETLSAAARSLFVEATVYAAIGSCVVVVGEAFAFIVVVSPLRDSFILGIPLVSASIAVLCFRQYAVDPLFIVFRQPYFVTLGPTLVTAGLVVGWGMAEMRLLDGPLALYLLLATSIVGLVIPVLLIERTVGRLVDRGTIAALAVSSALAICLTPHIELAPVARLLFSSVICLVIFFSCLAITMSARRLAAKCLL